MCRHMEYIWKTYVFLLFWYAHPVNFVFYINHETTQINNKKVSYEQKQPHKNRAGKYGFIEPNFIIWSPITLSTCSEK